jgi:hypothetical protein
MQLRTAAALIVAFLFSNPVRGQEIVLTFDQPQTAGISGFRVHWNAAIPLADGGATKIVDPIIKDRSPTAVWSSSSQGGKPGAIAFDALNRSLLVRFPGSAARIFDQVRQGYAIRKMELVLPFRDTELWPPGDTDYAPPDGYLYRMNWGVDELYRKLTPQWHAVAWALRRPWQSDERLGPTFNAYINGSGFWTKFGAGDEHQDRFPMRFGPVEVSDKAPEGRLDITALVNDSSFGSSLGARLQYVECCGFIINKLETYDARYYTGATTGMYEWATATGGRAILIKSPRLVVTFSQSKNEDANTPLGDLPTAINVVALAETLTANRSGGRPTATLASEDELAELTKKFAARPIWMSEWQWQRINELKALDQTRRASQAFYYTFVPQFVIDRIGASHGPGSQARPAEVFGAWVDSIMGRQPRGWSGFEPALEMTQWFAYRDALPAPAREAFKRYWTAWLMPDRQSAPPNELLDRNVLDGTLVHPQADQLSGDAKSYEGVSDIYYAKTGDWRGNKSFYRSGYTRTVSTENFNHTAAAGALLGGAIIGSKNAIADGRHGWETYPLRLWTWSRGAGQENIDPYYFAITLSHQKAVADFGPTLFDRLMTEGMLARSIDELIAAYHPALKRFVAGSARTSLEYSLAEQDGLQYVLHTLSHIGTLHDVGNPEIKNLLPGLQSVIGEEMPPQRAALQATTTPWAPDWVTNLVDDKPLPYRAMAVSDGVVASYLGHNYGIATATNTRRIQFLAQWRRDTKPVANMSDVVSVFARYGMNDTRFANDASGWIAPLGSETFLQYDNKVLMLASPRDASWVRERAAKGGIKSLQTSIAFFNYQQPSPNWEIYVDGDRILQLPFTAPSGAKISIRDGVSYIGVVPLAGTDLGGGNAVVLREGTAEKWDNITFKPELVIDSYNLKSNDAIMNPDWDRIDKAFGGFAIELADSGDYASFGAFQEHLASTEVQTRFSAPFTVSATYKSGKDIIQTNATKTREELTLVEPKVNGRPGFLPAGVLRDTSTSVQGDAIAIEKLGAVLRGEQGRMKFLQVEPKSGTFVGWNPLPDLATFSLAVPGGMKVQSEGRLGLARVLVNPGQNRVEISQAWGEEQQVSATAPALVLTGFKEPPTVKLNGVETNLTTKMVSGERAFLVPLISTADEIKKSAGK